MAQPHSNQKLRTLFGNQYYVGDDVFIGLSTPARDRLLLKTVSLEETFKLSGSVVSGIIQDYNDLYITIISLYKTTKTLKPFLVEYQVRYDDILWVSDRI